MRLMKLDFKEIKHFQGKETYIADTLTRLQVREKKGQSTIEEDGMIAPIHSVISLLPVSDSTLQQKMDAPGEDPVCSVIKEYCHQGWLDKYSINDDIKPY